ncbi:MAG: hypothetical protein ACRDIW_04300, partial [Actinomycetota bacterium]
MDDEHRPAPIELTVGYEACGGDASDGLTLAIEEHPDLEHPERRFDERDLPDLASERELVEFAGGPL